MSDSLLPHVLQHCRPPCPSLTHRVYSNLWQPNPVFLPGESQGEPGGLPSMGSHRVGHNWSDLAAAAAAEACPLSQRCLPTISSSVVPFSSCIQFFPASGSFSNELAIRIMWPKYWSFSFSFSPSNEYSGLLSFRIDWLNLLTVQGTLKSLLQHHSSKASILPCTQLSLWSNFHIHIWLLEKA